MTNHLKQIASPKSWPAKTQPGRFAIKPNCGAQPMAKGLPLGSLLRDSLKIASTMGEIQKVLNNNEILVDGKRRKDHQFVIGFFDLIRLPFGHQNYRLIIDRKGRLIPLAIEPKEAEFKICKITGKKALPGKKVQFNLHDGKCLIGDFSAKVGDSLAINIPEIKVREVLPLKEGAEVFLLEGKHCGDLGTLRKISGVGAVYSRDDQEIETAKKYLFVVGKDKPLISLGQEKQKDEKHKKAKATGK